MRQVDDMFQGTERKYRRDNFSLLVVDRTVDITQKRRPFKNTKETEKIQRERWANISLISSEDEK